ncbi:MAG: hypothetical protein ACYTDW_18410 [Planctomycetota bacterium]
MHSNSFSTLDSAGIIDALVLTRIPLILVKPVEIFGIYNREFTLRQRYQPITFGLIFYPQSPPFAHPLKGSKDI